ADDLTDPAQGFKPGWDRLSGYGRVDALRAVEQVAPGTIPPEARLDAPFIYSPHDRPFGVQGVAGGAWKLQLGPGEEPASSRVVGTGRGPIVRARLHPAADLNGRVYAWSARGRLLHGFPYRIKLAKPGHDDRGSRQDSAVYASPALADLNGDGKLDIVFGAADQRIYAIDGRGRDLPGWPVLARDTPDGDAAKILSSPAIGDLDGDKRPDVVEGTAEVYGSTPQTTGRVYALDRLGRRLPGWPIHPAALSA